MSDWVVEKPARELNPGNRIVFSEKMGGEGEILTVAMIQTCMGTAEIWTNELYEPILWPSQGWVEVR